jgi:hypothetical protein
MPPVTAAITTAAATMMPIIKGSSGGPRSRILKGMTRVKSVEVNWIMTRRKSARGLSRRGLSRPCTKRPLS